MSRFHDEFFQQRGIEHDRLILKCLSKEGQIKILSDIDFQKDGEEAVQLTKHDEPITSLLIDYETEVLCKSVSGFIIGYADIVFTLQVRTSESPHDPLTYVKYIIEVKPKINDFGAVLRQLKTYKSVLERAKSRYVGPITIPIRMIIVTTSSVPCDVIEYLAHEQVRLVRIGEA